MELSFPCTRSLEPRGGREWKMKESLSCVTRDSHSTGRKVHASLPGLFPVAADSLALSSVLEVMLRTSTRLAYLLALLGLRQNNMVSGLWSTAQGTGSRLDRLIHRQQRAHTWPPCTKDGIVPVNFTSAFSAAQD